METAEKSKIDSILVIGLGNTIVSDDGIGIRAVEEFEKKYSNNMRVTCEVSSKYGIELLPVFEGHSRAIVVDAIKTTCGIPGDIYTFDLDDLTCTGHSTSPHSLNLYSTVEFGRRCGLEMPKKVEVVAIEIEDNVNFGEDFTPGVKAALKKVVDILWKIVQNL